MSRIKVPRFSEIDAWGLTHPGNVRDQNQDHFFVGSLARGIAVDATSIDESDASVLHLDRMASLGLVADGVGGRAGGEEAARRAVQELVSSVSRFFHRARYEESEDPEIFSRLLHEAALSVHEGLVRETERRGGSKAPATTLTLFLGLWPHAYLLQVGDSRCYIYQNGALTQISQDQTLAQELVDRGVLVRSAADRSQWANVLSSAIGGDQAVPVVTRVTRDWGTVVLLCSDGLTKHVSNEQIEHRLSSMTSARQVAEQLLQDALDGGGTDNVTVVVGRTLKPRPDEDPSE